MKIRSLFFAFIALLSIFCGGSELISFTKNSLRLHRSWGEREFRSNGSYLDLPRQLVRDFVPENESFFLLCRNEMELTPIERSLHLSLLWDRMPQEVRYGATDQIGAAASVLAESGCRKEQKDALTSAGFQPVHEAGGRTLWKKTDTIVAPSAEKSSLSSRSLNAMKQELPGLLLIVSVFAVGVLFAGISGGVLSLYLLILFLAGLILCGEPPTRPSLLLLSGLSLVLTFFFRKKIRFQSHTEKKQNSHIEIAYCTVATLLFTLFASACTLSHTFIAPNGLGVSGGKAKLFYLCGTFPAGFENLSQWSTLQPAYPPGLSLLTLAGYSISDFCGDYLTQLLTVAAMSIVLFMLLRTASCLTARLWITAAFFLPLPRFLASAFYSEAFMALFFLCGAIRIFQNPEDRLGWLFVGGAALFKNEGIIYAGAFLLGTALVYKKAMPMRKLALNAAIALSLPACWHLGIRLAGAALQDYAPFSGLFSPLSFSQGKLALLQFVREAFVSPQAYAFVFPTLLLTFFFKELRTPELRISAWLLFFCFLAFTGIFALSRASDFSWHLNSMQRLLWLPSLLALTAISGRKRS